MFNNQRCAQTLMWITAAHCQRVWGTLQCGCGLQAPIVSPKSGVQQGALMNLVLSFEPQAKQIETAAVMETGKVWQGEENGSAPCKQQQQQDALAAMARAASSAAAAEEAATVAPPLAGAVEASWVSAEALPGSQGTIGQWWVHVIKGSCGPGEWLMTACADVMDGVLGVLDVGLPVFNLNRPRPRCWILVQHSPCTALWRGQSQNAGVRLDCTPFSAPLRPDWSRHRVGDQSSDTHHPSVPPCTTPIATAAEWNAH